MEPESDGVASSMMAAFGIAILVWIIINPFSFACREWPEPIPAAVGFFSPVGLLTALSALPPYWGLLLIPSLLVKRLLRRPQAGGRFRSCLGRLLFGIVGSGVVLGITLVTIPYLAGIGPTCTSLVGILILLVLAALS